MLDNSFEDVCSEESSSEDYDNEYGSDEYGDEDEATKKTKKQSTINQPPKRCVINVFCTEYDVIPRVARKYLNFKLKNFEEDHDGGVHGNEKGLKLKPDWDITWHDLGITADFLSKLEPYQKVSQYPGMYVITRKNYMARNLMKMQKAFPDEYKFFPRTWIMP